MKYALKPVILQYRYWKKNLLSYNRLNGTFVPFLERTEI
jgi:hypothetical protein